MFSSKNLIKTKGRWGVGASKKIEGKSNCHRKTFEVVSVSVADGCVDTGADSWRNVMVSVVVIDADNIAMVPVGVGV